MKKYLLALFIIPVLILAFSSSISAQSATVTIDSPTGSSQWPVGSSQTVRWTAVGVFDYYQTIIQIRDASDSISFNLAISAVGEDWQGQKAVTIPATLPAESYKIIVQITYNNSNSVARGVSSLFQVTAATAPTGSISIIAPAAGDTWYAGDTNYITWDPGDVPGNVMIRRYRAALYPSTGSGWTTGLTPAGTPNDGSYTVAPGVLTPAPDSWYYTISSVDDPSIIALGGVFNVLSGTTPGDGGPPPDNDPDFIIDLPGWKPPTQVPPDCDDPAVPGCWPPINVSARNQIKSTGDGSDDSYLGGLAIGPLLVVGGAEIRGILKLPFGIGDADIGKVLTLTAADGTAGWRPGGGSGGGDNLGVTGAPGSHTATQPLILGSWSMHGSGGGQPSFLLNELSSSDGGLQVVNMKDSGYPSLLVDNPRIGGPVDREVFTVRGSGGAAAFNVKRNAVCIFGDCRDTWPTSSGDPSPSVWQKRVINSCAEGYSIREISDAGVVTCEFDDGGVEGAGDITAVNTPTGSGLSGGATSGAVNLSLKTCTDGQVLKWINSATKWDCGMDNASGGLRTDCATGEILQWFGSPINQWRCERNLYTTANTDGGLDIIPNPSIPSNLLASIKDGGVTTAKIANGAVTNAKLGLSFSQYTRTPDDATSPSLGQHKVCFLKTVAIQSFTSGIVSKCDLNVFTDSAYSTPKTNLDDSALGWWTLDRGGQTACQVICYK